MCHVIFSEYSPPPPWVSLSTEITLKIDAIDLNDPLFHPVDLFDT